MTEITQKQAHQVWLAAAEKVKDRVIAPTLYRALELPVGLAVEGDEFILGFANQDVPMAGHLRSAQHRAIIDQCVSEVLKQKVRVRIIEGTSLDDYANYKRQLQARDATSTTISAQKEEERRILAAWDEYAEKITRTYARLPLRQLAQSRAQFMWDAFRMLNEALETMGYSDDSSEMQKRAFGRVLEKLATVIDIPSTMLAFEFFKLRDEGKL